ncbi:MULTISPECIES: prepilin-type N-terminal cleavage/methylation domain-containing protein [unclassified Herbaspirillum]|nr:MULTISPECIES: prepilin-type N-terminal cleavage/methylation domain-containing protein [unclassified Herbaspirillum]
MRAEGFTLIEVTVALIVMATMLAAGAAYLNRYNDSIANESVAGQMRRLGDAAGQYVADNYEKLSSQEDGTLLDWRDMKRYLPPGIDQNTVNPFGQRYNGALRVVPLKDDNKRIEVLIFTEPARGAKQPDVATHSMKVAQLIGAGGLYLDHDGRKPGARAVYWSSYGQLTDQSSLAGFFKKTPTAIGQIFYAPFMRDTSGPGTLAGDLLHRKKTDGHPEWNKMEADIDMSKHKIDDVASIKFSGDGQGKSPSIYANQSGGPLVIDPGDDGRIVMGADGNNPSAGVVVNSLKAGGEVAFGTKIVMAGKDFYSEGERCHALSMTMNESGDLMTCDSKSRVWRRLSYATQYRYTGRLREASKSFAQHFPSGRADVDAVRYSEIRNSTWDYVVNNYDEPVTVIVSKAATPNSVMTGDDTRMIKNGNYPCGIFVYESLNGRWPSENELPIAETSMPSFDTGVKDAAICSLTFVARANTTYYVAYSGQMFDPNDNAENIRGGYVVLHPDS